MTWVENRNLPQPQGGLMKKSTHAFSSMLISISLTMLAGCGYNDLVSFREETTSQWSQVENAYQRRLDLIPNLVEVTKGYAAHESGVFTAIADARARIGEVRVDPSNMTEEDLARFQSAQQSLGGALSRLLVLKEAYPELKANEQFARLTDEIAGSENRISNERRLFNEKAQRYNQRIKQIPDVFYAGYFGFKEVPYYKADDAARQAPKVNFSGER